MKRFRMQGDIIFGEGSIGAVGEIIQDHSVQKVLIITDKGLVNAGVIAPLLEIVKAHAKTYYIFDEVMPNPTDDLVNTCARRYENSSIDMIIAIGGGSVMDAAKSINLLLSHGGIIEDYYQPGKIKNETLVLIAIPTTSGTASEVTEVSVITDTKQQRKVVIGDKKLAADYSILDSALTYGLPTHITASTGMDALTHGIEAYVSILATPFTDINAKASIDLILSNIELAVADGRNRIARENMQLGSSIAGFAFNSAILGLVHAIAHPLGAHYNVPHGVANAIMLPYVMGYNGESCGEKLSYIGGHLGLERDQCTPENVEEKLLALNERLGISNLRSTGITESEFEFLAGEVMKEPSIAMNPRKVLKEDVIDLLKKAYRQS